MADNEGIFTMSRMCEMLGIFAEWLLCVAETGAQPAPAGE